MASDIQFKPIPPDETPRRTVVWTEDQHGVFNSLVPDALVECAETSRRCTTFLIVGDRTIRLRYDDVTDDKAMLEATKEIMENERNVSAAD